MSFITKKLEEFDENVFGDCFAGGIFNDNENQVMYTSGFKDGFNKAKKMSKSFLSTALDEMIMEVDTNISRLLQKVADSPLDKRLNGWDALLEVRKSLSSLREGNK